MNYEDEGFRELEFFPRQEGREGEVYVLLFNDGITDREFYVGQTGRFLGRMDDYFWAMPSAATDFKVGIAIRYFCSKPNGRVIVKHKCVKDRLAEEARLIELFKKQPLLNDKGLGFDYRNVNLNEVRDKIHAKCEEIIRHQNV